MKNLFILMLITLICGCAAIPEVVPPSEDTKDLSGIYHEVKKGQTLWRISKEYHVDLLEVMRVNNIDDPDIIKVGQVLFIPKTGRSNRGRYISYEPAEYAPDSSFIWPVKSRTIASGFSPTGENPNKGINIDAEEGQEVYASKGGIITSAGTLKGYGNIVIIDHLDGYYTLYAHNSKNLVKKGQNVKKGDIIALVGRTGRPKQCMLHFEIRKGHKAQDPARYLK